MPDGSKKELNKRGFVSMTAALKWIKETQTDAIRGEYLEPSKQPFGDYLATYLDGLRLAPSTIASYRKMARLHINNTPLAGITPQRLDALYRTLETSGRRRFR
jgi:integrase